METVSLLIGIIAGGVVASLIWIISNVIIGNKEKAVLNERNSILNSIGELIAEADTLLMSFSIGSASKERVKSDITRIMEAIRKLYKPNIHIFEVFYVKYVDTLLNHYSGYLKESSAVQNAWDESAHHLPKTVPIEKSEISRASAVVQGAALVQEKTEPVVNVKAESTVSVKSVPEIEAEKEISEIMLGTDAVSENTKLSAKADEFSIEPISSAHLEILPIEDADIPEFAPEIQDISTGTDDLQQEESDEIASASIPQEQESEISFEEMAQDVLAVEEVNETGFSSIANKPLEDQVQQIESVESGSSLCEEFSMETIMDLDMSKIPGFNSEKSKITIKPKAEKPVESRLDDDSEISFEPGKSHFSSQETKKIHPQSIPVKSTDSNGEIKTPLSFGKQKAELSAKLSQSDIKPEINQTLSNVPDQITPQNNQNNAEKEHYTITGDDVADQIDSFFGFHK
jgi:hypothetical protein